METLSVVEINTITTYGVILTKPATVGLGSASMAGLYLGFKEVQFNCTAI